GIVKDLRVAPELGPQRVCAQSSIKLNLAPECILVVFEIYFDLDDPILIWTRYKAAFLNVLAPHCLFRKPIAISRFSHRPTGYRMKYFVIIATAVGIMNAL